MGGWVGGRWDGWVGGFMVILSESHLASEGVLCCLLFPLLLNIDAANYNPE